MEYRGIPLAPPMVLAPSSNTSTRKGKTSRVRAKQEHNSCMHAHSERFQCYVLFAELMIG